ncbi:hypothetical protein JAAARDRAFT_255494 [Jaapia argillacea MUCL 33604]|uniref:Protein kinase domain-containing protein n=1 Tax=Jaapia argillacea MUCL 33604 TaxID=933084 RepID=A0A067PTK3_9AGAM|nr:hypothetical protein JAAARDRAFT_255494 [Jaapia argillacea MUCL 33604]
MVPEWRFAFYAACLGLSFLFLCARRWSGSSVGSNLVVQVEPEAFPLFPWKKKRVADLYPGQLANGREVVVRCLRSSPSPLRIRQFLDAQHRLQNRFAPVLVIIGVSSCFPPTRSLVTPYHGVDIMQYLEGHTLNRRQRLRLIVQMAEGVAYCHKLHLTHGDIRGSHVLVNDLGVVKLIAMQFHLLLYRDAYNPPSYIWEWTAPELLPGQIDDDEAEVAPTFASDVYSWAMTLLQIWTGRKPFAEFHIKNLVTFLIRLKQNPSIVLDLAQPDDMLVGLWHIFRDCSDTNAASRPTMEVVLARLAAVERQL